MGYYNDIALALSKKADKKLKQKLEAMNPEVVGLFTKYYDAHLENVETGNVLYFWKEVKSYEDELEFIQLFIRGLDDEEFNLLRLGEDHETVGDIEQVGQLHCPEFDLQVSAVITFRGGKGIKTKNTNNKLEN